MGFTTKDLQLLCNKTENTPLWGGAEVVESNWYQKMLVQNLYIDI